MEAYIFVKGIRISVFFLSGRLKCTKKHGVVAQGPVRNEEFV